MDNVSNIGSGESKINKTAHNMLILRGILKRYHQWDKAAGVDPIAFRLELCLVAFLQNP